MFHRRVTIINNIHAEAPWIVQIRKVGKQLEQITCQHNLHLTRHSIERFCLTFGKYLSCMLARFTRLVSGNAHITYLTYTLL